jgi:hypothetical protein
VFFTCSTRARTRAEIPYVSGVSDRWCCVCVHSGRPLHALSLHAEKPYVDACGRPRLISPHGPSMLARGETYGRRVYSMVQNVFAVQPVRVPVGSSCSTTTSTGRRAPDEAPEAKQSLPLRCSSTCTAYGMHAHYYRDGLPVRLAVRLYLPCE